MKKCAILSFTPLRGDPRINRQVGWLSPLYDLVTLGPAHAPITGIPCLDCGITPRSKWMRLWRAGLLASRQFERFYWQSPHVQTSYAKLKTWQPELIIANDIDTLPLALRLQEQLGARVIFDAHEFYPDVYAADPIWKTFVQPYMRYLCQRYMPQADARITVSPGVAKLYRDWLGLEPELVYNAPNYQQLSPQKTDPGHIRLIHHGNAIPDRKLESMIEMMSDLDARFELYLMLVPSAVGYLEQLKQKAEGHSRIHFIEPVSLPEIVGRIHSFDIGLYLLPAVHNNNLHALPNKFFEFIQGRLALAISPNPDMANIVQNYQCGLVSPDYRPESLTSLLNSLDADQIDNFKQASDRASRELCAETAGKRFLAVAQSLCPV